MWWLLLSTAGADTLIDGRTWPGELATDEPVVVVPGEPKVDLSAFTVVSDEGEFTLEELVWAADELAGEPISVLKVIADGEISDEEYTDWGVDLKDQTIQTPICVTILGFTLCWGT
jgi:hypothetical protein